MMALLQQAGALLVSQPPTPAGRASVGDESACAFVLGKTSINCGTSSLALCHMFNPAHQCESFFQLILRLCD